MTESEYIAFRSIGSLVDFQCNRFFDMLKVKGLIDKNAEFRDHWSDFCDERKSFESEIFDRISEISYYTKKHEDTKKDKLKTAYHHFVETEKPILENSTEYESATEKQIQDKLKKIWRDLSDYEKVSYTDRVSKEKLYKDYAKTFRQEVNNTVSTAGENICTVLEDVKIEEKESENPETEHKKRVKESNDKICVSEEMQYQKNGKEMFRIELSYQEEEVIEDIYKNIEKNTLKVLHKIMKNIIGIKSVSKYNKENAVKAVSDSIKFL